MSATASEGTSTMTFYYAEAGRQGITSFEVNPQLDTNAPAKAWRPSTDDWVDVKGLSAGAEVVWSGEYHQIDEAQVPEIQRLCREQWAMDVKAGRVK
jgi:hypothetical protein